MKFVILAVCSQLKQLKAIYPCGLITQWIEHCTGIARSWVRIPFKPEFFFSACFFNWSWEQLHVLRGSQISLMSIHSLIWFSYIHIQVYSEWYLLWWDFWCDKTEVFAAVLVSLELICGRPRWPLHTFLLKMFNTCLPLKYFNNSWTEC